MRRPRQGGVTTRAIMTALAERRGLLTEPEAKKLVRRYGIATPDFRLAANPSAVARQADIVGYPVVIKVVSPDIVHKSDVGGVAVGLRSRREVGTRARQMLTTVRRLAPTARLEGFLVERMAEKSVEVAIGGLRDPQFGPVVMFGSGGLLVELYQDVAFRLAPIATAEAVEMMGETKAYAQLRGFRGSPKLDIAAVAKALVAVSTLMMREAAVAQLDLNPIFVYRRGLLAVDARVVLAQH